MAGMRAEAMNKMMRGGHALRGLLALALPLALVACGGAKPEPEAAAPPPPRLDFAGKQGIPVRLDLRASADGGRAAAIAGAWRGEFVFDGGSTTRCGIDRGELPELQPGSSNELRLICARAVRLPDDGSRGFRLLEEGREVGSGVVLP